MIALRIEPSRFIASNGLLDSNFQYISMSLGQQYLFAHPVGRTISVQNGGIQYAVDGFRNNAGTGSTFNAAFIKMEV